MGQFLPKPNTEKHGAHGAGNGLRFGLSSMQGWRVTMEDAHTAVVGLPGGRADWSFFAVYDGHAGSRVADYCAGHMLDHILSSLGGSGGGSVKDDIRSGFLKIDVHMRGLPEMQQGPDLQLEGPGPQEGPQGPSSNRRQQEADRSGCTAVGVLLSPDHLYFINCGDSRAVLYRDGRVSFSTVDHKPYDAGEMERIRNAGGHIMNGRVNGGLAVSRALGDYEYKGVEGKGPTEQPVSPEPEVREWKRASGEGDEFVVLACDGVWDVMNNEELGAFVRSRLQLWSDLETVCNAVVDTCLHKGSKDNMSVVLVCFPGAPKVSKEAQRKEKELEEFLETRVGELLKRGGVTGVPDLVKTLATENINNLPPGGGLDSKRSVIEAAYNKLNPRKEEEKAKESPLENGKADDPNPTQEATIQ